MSTQKNLITLCFAAVFTLGLAACGGGGGDAPVTGMPDDPVTGMPDDPVTGMPDDMVEPEALACDAGPSQDCVDARQAELEAIENDSDATVGALNAAEMALDTAQTELTDANTAAAAEMTVSDAIGAAITATADITDESTLAEVAVGRAAIDAAQESLKGMDNLSDDVTADLQGRIDTLEAGYSPIEMTVDTNAKTAAAATKRTEIDAEAIQMPDAGLGGTVDVGTDPSAISTYMLTVARDRDGTKITITDTANPAAAEPANPQFAQARDLGGGRTMHVRTMEADANGNVVEEVVIVSTDIDAPKATPFAMVEGQALLANPKTTGQEDFRSIAVAAGDDGVNLPKIMAARFTAGTAAVLTFKFDMAATEDIDEADEVAGTYNGAMGTYRCDGEADCTVDINAMGKVSNVGGMWVFTPDKGATSDVADANYLQYGFWLMKTTKDGADTYDEVETFAEAAGHPVTGATELNAVTGAAIYEGGSVGVYVKNVLDDQANIVSATSGHFSADVELTASFGGGNVPMYDQFTIGGKITGFVLQHGEANDWAVGLGLADFGNRVDGEPGKSDPGSGHTIIFDGPAIGDSTAAAGTWNGMFHGAAGIIGEGEAAVNTKPAAVTGEFNANFTDGTAAGGFGANKK